MRYNELGYTFAPMAEWKAASWRWYRNYLTGLACCMEPGTIEYKNVMRRAAWIERNRL